MRIVKGIAMGLLAMLAALIALVVGVGWWVSRSAPPGESIGWDPVSMFRQQPLVPLLFVAFLCLTFALGFAFGYRRLRRIAQ